MGVRSGKSHACNHPVALGDHIFDVILEVWEATPANFL
jgi:hypothetical protein